MQRIPIQERPDWRESAENTGFSFHTIGGLPYWDETAYYAFTLNQIENDLEEPTAELHALCMELVDRATHDDEILMRLAIPETAWDVIKESYQRNDPSLYGRFDFSYDGKNPAKLLEYNADTPTSLFEASGFQWSWLEEQMARGALPADRDQFNSIHDKIVNALDSIIHGRKFFGTSVEESAEDYGTVAYILECATLAGAHTHYVPLEQIGLLSDGYFCSAQDEPIALLFKLYPWEWMFTDEYGSALRTTPTRFLEPPWKAILSNKGILPLLWEMEPDHPNLLPAFFDNDPQKYQLGPSFVKKPLFSREGANVLLIDQGAVINAGQGNYGKEGHIRQAVAHMPVFQGNYPVIGSWIIAGEPAGIGIREDISPVTQNDSRFLPHVILP